MSEFDVIKQARELLSGRKVASEKTTRAYQVELDRLGKKAGSSNFADVIAAARDTKSSATWYRRRAAILSTFCKNTSDLLKKQDLIQREIAKKPGDSALETEWKNLVGEIRIYSKFIAKTNSIPPLPIENRKPRSTKKRSLRGLPGQWREDLAKRFSPKYRLPFLVAAATGCRPAELAEGVEIAFDRDEKTGNTSIRVTIPGAKVRAESGQPSRIIFITIDNVDGSIATQLAAAINAGQRTVKIPTSEKLFSGAVRDAGRREWKGRRLELSAYSLRHQFAADMKNGNFSEEDIAKALGHATVKTASYYGDRKQSSGGGVKLDAVQASRKVKKNNKKIKYT